MSSSIYYLVALMVMRQVRVFSITSKAWRPQSKLSLNKNSHVNFKDANEDINGTKQQVATKLQDSHSRSPNGFPKLNYVLSNDSLSFSIRELKQCVCMYAHTHVCIKQLETSSDKYFKEPYH